MRVAGPAQVGRAGPRGKVSIDPCLAWATNSPDRRAGRGRVHVHVASGVDRSMRRHPPDATVQPGERGLGNCSNGFWKC